MFNQIKMIPTPQTTHFNNYHETLNPGTTHLKDDDEVTVVTSNVTNLQDHDQDQDQDLPRKVSCPSQFEPAATVVEAIQPTNDIRQQRGTNTTAQARAKSGTINKRQQINHAQFACNLKLHARHGERAVELAILDSGATGHFLVTGAPAVNVVPAKNPINILLPNGKRIQSTHTCNLDIPWLPAHITEAHIVPGLSHSSLISTQKFCDAGCTVVFDEEEC